MLQRVKVELEEWVGSLVIPVALFQTWPARGGLGGPWRKPSPVGLQGTQIGRQLHHFGINRGWRLSLTPQNCAALLPSTWPSQRGVV